MKDATPTALPVHLKDTDEECGSSFWSECGRRTPILCGPGTYHSPPAPNPDEDSTTNDEE